MASETHTGRLIIGESEIAVEDGTVLAVPGPNPRAAAVGLYARWGQTQPVTVTGNPGIVDNIPVLYVTSIGWADEPVSAAASASSFSGGGSGSTVSVTAAASPAMMAKAPAVMAKKAAAVKKSAVKKAEKKAVVKKVAKATKKKAAPVKSAKSRSKR